MRIKLLFLFFIISSFFVSIAQETPTRIKYGAWDIHALRYYPFTTAADSIVEKVIAKYATEKTTQTTAGLYSYRKTSADFVVNKQFIEDQIKYSAMTNDIFFKYVIKPFSPWLVHARPIEESSKDLDLNLILFEDYGKGNKLQKSNRNGLLESLGYENTAQLLNELFGDIDLFRNKNDILLYPFPGPLSNNAPKTYKYYFSSNKEVDSTPVYEIVFLSKNPKKSAFEGYLYITKQDLSLVKAVFTLNNSMHISYINDVLITHEFTDTELGNIPEKKESVALLGDDMRGGILATQTNLYNRNEWQQIPPQPLTSSQMQIQKLEEDAKNTKYYKRSEAALSLAPYNHIGIGKHKYFELGPLTQIISYNKMEGIRLKAGGRTSMNLNKHVMVGGYLAYGFKDEQFKYRGDIIYSHNLKDKLHFTYVRDLNIPGFDLLTSQRDNFFYSFTHSGTQNMSLQKIGQLSFEKQLPYQFSFKVGARYLYDKPLGTIRYLINNVGNEVPKLVEDITTSEINLSLRYAPGEKFIQSKNKRIYLRRGDIELNLNHRVGLKDVLASDYNYHITEVSAFKRFNLPGTVGAWDINLSAGKVWDRVPFPLLFIPAGNQSYIYDKDDYNLMNFYEFSTDQFVSGNTNILFNWSPLSLISSRIKVKTTVGAKMLYGPLSDNNNPALHPELFIFNNGIEPLGDKPYTEINVGLTNILRFFRIDYVRRLSYGDKGSIFFSSTIAF